MSDFEKRIARTLGPAVAAVIEARFVALEKRVSDLLAEPEVEQKPAPKKKASEKKPEPEVKTE